MADVSLEGRPQFEEKTKSDPRALAALRILWPSSAVDRSSARRTCSARQPFCLQKNGSAARPMKLAKRLDTNQAARHEQRRRRRRPVDRHHSPRPAGSVQHRSTGANQNSLIIPTKYRPHTSAPSWNGGCGGQGQSADRRPLRTPPQALRRPARTSS